MKYFFIIISFIFLASCTQQQKLEDLQTFSGFSEEEELMYAQHAIEMEKKLFQQEPWNENDVVELARDYEYSGRLGKTILLYKEYEKQRKKTDLMLGDAVTHNMAVAYERIEDYKNAIKYYEMHLENYGRKADLKKLSELYALIGKDDKSKTYIERYNAEKNVQIDIQ